LTQGLCLSWVGTTCSGVGDEAMTRGQPAKGARDWDMSQDIPYGNEPTLALSLTHTHSLFHWHTHARTDVCTCIHT
jgi:hypothetical protein